MPSTFAFSCLCSAYSDLRPFGPQGQTTESKCKVKKSSVKMHGRKCGARSTESFGRTRELTSTNCRFQDRKSLLELAGVTAAYFCIMSSYVALIQGPADQPLSRASSDAGQASGGFSECIMIRAVRDIQYAVFITEQSTCQSSSKWRRERSVYVVTLLRSLLICGQRG